RGLAAELLVKDGAGQRVDRVEGLAPARVGLDRPEPAHPRAQLAVALAQVRERRFGIESPRLSRHVPFSVSHAAGRKRAAASRRSSARHRTAPASATAPAAPPPAGCRRTGTPRPAAWPAPATQRDAAPVAPA